MSADTASDLGDARRNTLRMLAVAGAVVLGDQVSKWIASGAVDSGGDIDLVLGFRIVDVSNQGIAFGLFDDGGALVPAVTLVALAALVAWFAFDRRRPWLWLGVGLLAGGALGNLIDRVRENGVTDFLDPPLWPAFNLADVAITAGVVTLALVALASERRPDGGA